MYGVVDSVEVQSLSALCQIKLAGGCAVLSVYTHLQVLLGGVGYNLAEQLCELSSVLCFLECSLLPVQADFRIALAVGNASHCQIHTNLRALALKVSTQVSHDVLRSALCNAYNVLSSPGLFASLLLELLSRCVADRALCRSCFAFIYITTYGTNKLFHDFFLLYR